MLVRSSRKATTPLALPTQTYPHSQAQEAVLVDHVEEIEPPLVSGSIELGVHCPDLVRVFSLMAL